jgi:hypothetical protein
LGRSEMEKQTGAMSPEDQALYQDFGAEAQSSLLSDGYAFVRGEQRFNTSINAIATPYRPSEFGEPVVFLSGAKKTDLTDNLITESLGPALVTAVQELLHITGRRFPILSED